MNPRTALTIAIAAVAAAGCGTTITKTPAAPATTTTAPPAATTSAAASPSAPLSGPPGTTYTVTSSDGTSYTVTLDQVNQHATPGPYETPTNPSDHFAAAEFTITGVNGNTSDDANSDANAIGSDGVQYPFAAALLDVPNFSSGEFNVSPGQSVKGWVAFELPPGVSVASVQWAPSLAGDAATWTVSG